MTRQPTKFMGYFDMLGACKEEGCPICSLVAKTSLRSLDNLMWERVNDPRTREHLLASQGFCNWHAWMLLQVEHSRSGIAILHEHLVRKQTDILESLRRFHSPERPWKRLLRRLFGTAEEAKAVRDRKRKAPCPICAQVGYSEETYLTICLQFVTDPDFQRSFESSFGLCLPHLYMAASLEPDHPNLPALLQQQIAKMEAIKGDLQEFIRKQDYRFRNELVGGEGTAWQRSIELLTGKAGVFGPERPLTLFAPPRPTPPPQEAAQTDTALPSSLEELQQENERLRFENEKLRRRIDEITKLWSEESSRAASLHFQVYELSKDKQVLEFNLAGAEGESKGWEGVVSRLREEIAVLQEELRRLKEHPSTK